MFDEKNILLKKALELEEEYIMDFIPFIKKNILESEISAKNLKRIIVMLNVLENDSINHKNQVKALLEDKK